MKESTIIITRLSLAIIAIVLLTLTVYPSIVHGAGDPSHDFSLDGLTEEQKTCYKVGTIGYDSVVNARLGVSLEQMQERVTIEGQLSAFLLSTVTNAYHWPGSPHAYAIKTSDTCRVLLELMKEAQMLDVDHSEEEEVWM